MTSIQVSFRFVLALALAIGLAVADEHSRDKPGIRILSWNVSDDSFVSHTAEFQALVSRANPDVLLLDEVSPSADIDKLNDILEGLRATGEDPWHINIGASGGRQRNVVARTCWRPTIRTVPPPYHPSRTPRTLREFLTLQARRPS